MEFSIKNRWSGEVIFTAEIEASEETPFAIRIGLAVKKAIEVNADLRSANLSSANLRTFKADFWMILAQNAHEVPGLIDALKDGRVDGSTYHGDCACLVGTIANVRGVHVDTMEQDSGRPAEQCFLMISKGDKPGDDSGGGFAAKQALEWAEEFLALWSPTPEPATQVA